jgi:hypothetical protein
MTTAPTIQTMLFIPHSHGLVGAPRGLVSKISDNCSKRPARDTVYPTLATGKIMITSKAGDLLSLGLGLVTGGHASVRDQCRDGHMTRSDRSRAADLQKASRRQGWPSPRARAWAVWPKRKWV